MSNNEKFMLPKKRNWELILASEDVKLLRVKPDGSGYEVQEPWVWNCVNCGQDCITPDPKPPLFCPRCNKRHFKPLFPPELLMVWDEKWRIPWIPPSLPEECDFRQLYSELKDFIKKHVVFPKEEEYDVLASWIMASWKAEQIPSTAYILLRGEHESGKTRVLEVLTRLAYRAIPTVGLSPAILFRQIESFGCTCLIDQAEDELNRKYEDGAMKYAIVASGYKQGMFVGRVDKENPKKIKYFETYSFKAMASTKSFDVAIDSRCIIIDMEENTPKNEDIDEEWAAKLRAKLLYWRTLNVPYEKVQTKLKRRTRELFLPLLWIAKLQGITEKIENFGVEYYKKRRRELPDEFRAAIISVIIDLEPEALKKEGDEAGRIYISEIKQAFVEKGWEDVSSSGIGRELANMDIRREGPAKGKGRYLVISDAETERKVKYYVEKFGLTISKEAKKQ